MADQRRRRHERSGQRRLRLLRDCHRRGRGIRLHRSRDMDETRVSPTPEHRRRIRSQAFRHLPLSWAGLAAGRGRLRTHHDSLYRRNSVSGRSRLFFCQAMATRSAGSLRPRTHEILATGCLRFKGKVLSGDTHATSNEPFRSYAQRWIDEYAGRTTRGLEPRQRSEEQPVADLDLGPVAVQRLRLVETSWAA